jgi:DNA-binding beta-propeller fold protein YncE
MYSSLLRKYYCEEGLVRTAVTDGCARTQIGSPLPTQPPALLYLARFLNPPLNWHTYAYPVTSVVPNPPYSTALQRCTMRRHFFGFALAIAAFPFLGLGQDAAGPYKVLKTVKVGGLGGFDYIQADDAGRRLYIPRGAVQGDNPKPGRVTIFDLDTLAPAGEIPNTRGNGAAVDPKSGHSFASSNPVAMWDTKTMTIIKTIEVDPKCRPDGIMADPFNQRIYVFSHPTMDATVIDAKDGKVLGTIDLGGAPEQAVSDGKGHVYVVIQDKSNVAVIDAKTMKVTAHYEFGGKGSRCNGLALDAKNRVLFAACGQSGNPPATPPQPMMVILDASDGKIITTLPLAGSSDGAVFNPKTMEAFSAHGNGTMTIVKENSPTSFVVEQNLQTMPGAKCLTLDTKTNHILTDAAEYGPPPAQPPVDAPKGRGARGPMLPDSFTILVIGK